MASEGLVQPETFEQVNRYLRGIGRWEAIRRLKAIEPGLWAAVTALAADASRRFEQATVENDLPGMANDSVEWAALIVAEILRREHYRLWADTAVGTRLGELDPDLARRAKGTGTDAGSRETPERE